MYALAEGSRGDEGSLEDLRRAAAQESHERPLAGLLLKALDSNRLEDRIAALDEATVWIRDHHPDAAPLWRGWSVLDGRLIETPTAGSREEPAQSGGRRLGTDAR
jgi:hypothetical protein